MPLNLCPSDRHRSTSKDTVYWGSCVLLQCLWYTIHRTEYLFVWNRNCRRNCFFLRPVLQTNNPPLCIFVRRQPRDPEPCNIVACPNDRRPRQVPEENTPLWTATADVHNV